jgi:hypothetical protein
VLKKIKLRWFRAVFGSVGVFVVAAFIIKLFAPAPALAACPALPTDKGMVTQTVNIASAGTYRVWSRIMAPDTTNNSYYLEIDDTTCGVNVGDTAIGANTWTWGDYKDGNTASKINVTLTAGNHTFRFIGREAGVKLDRVLLLTDSCIPTGTGDNCATSTDSTPPAVSVTAPAGGTTVSGTVNIAANASDNVGVTGVQFKLNGNNLGAEDTSAPYSISWDTTTVANGAYTLTAVARDAAGNATTSAAVSVTVNNQTTTNQADLVITNLSWTPANPTTGQPVTFKAVVKNQGTATTSKGPGLLFTVNGQPKTWVAHTSTTPFAPGETRELVANGGVGDISTWAAESGTHSVMGHVDDLGEIAESNNDNNTLTATLTVGTTAAKTGDLNGDNTVNIFDLSILLSNYGK